jgi:type IV secretion system protein VirD4
VPNVHFVLDEAKGLSHMQCIDDAIDKYRGYGVRLQLYYQSIGMLKECFPKDGGQTLLANTTQVFFGTQELDTASQISARLGEQTIVVESGGRGRSESVQPGHHGHRQRSYSTNSNFNWNQIARKLLKPEEILTLDERIAITFVQGMPPIWTRLERYYEARFGPPRFQGIKTFLGTILVAFTGTITAAFATLFLKAVMQ